MHWLQSLFLLTCYYIEDFEIYTCMNSSVTKEKSKVNKAVSWVWYNFKWTYLPLKSFVFICIHFSIQKDICWTINFTHYTIKNRNLLSTKRNHTSEKVKGFTYISNCNMAYKLDMNKLYVHVFRSCIFCQAFESFKADLYIWKDLSRNIQPKC